MKKQAYRLLKDRLGGLPKTKAGTSAKSLNISIMVQPPSLLIPMWKMVNYHLAPTRDEEDFAAFIKDTVNAMPDLDKVVIIADQFNTHLSASLVAWIAQEQEYEKDQLGIKRRSGVLKNQKSRRKFLENPEHRIRLVYTPKHCSWLNPIENWFAKLQRHVIKSGNFAAVNELENKIHCYIHYYSVCLAKPIKWKFKGFEKNKIFIS